MSLQVWMTAPFYLQRCEEWTREKTTPQSTILHAKSLQLQRNICLIYIYIYIQYIYIYVLPFMRFYLQGERKGDLADPQRGTASVSFSLPRQSTRQGCHIKAKMVLVVRTQTDPAGSLQDGRMCPVGTVDSGRSPSRCRHTTPSGAVRTGRGHGRCVWTLACWCLHYDTTAGYISSYLLLSIAEQMCTFRSASRLHLLHTGRTATHHALSRCTSLSLSLSLSVHPV